MTKNIQWSFETGFLEKLKSCKNAGEEAGRLVNLPISDLYEPGGLLPLAEMP